MWAHLRDMWADFPAVPGDPVNLLAPLHRVASPDEPGQEQLHATCSQEGGFIILHPDILLSGAARDDVPRGRGAHSARTFAAQPPLLLSCLALSSGTTVTSAVDCTRKAWIDQLIGGTSSDVALLGVLTHEVLQALLKLAVSAEQHGPVTEAQAKPLVHEALRDMAMKLYEVGLDEKKARNKLHENLGKVRRDLCRPCVPRSFSATGDESPRRPARELVLSGPGQREHTRASARQPLNAWALWLARMQVLPWLSAYVLNSVPRWPNGQPRHQHQGTHITFSQYYQGGRLERRTSTSLPAATPWDG